MLPPHVRLSTVELQQSRRGVIEQGNIPQSREARDVRGDKTFTTEDAENLEKNL
jgi:hypothetical protein